jgi:F-type H+-transporting ATPase subunit epsilon
VADRTIRCKVITRVDRVLDAEVTYANVPLWDGQAGFMEATAPFVAKVGVGELRVDLAQGGSKRWFVDGGFMQNVGGTLTILTGEATPADELDAEEARAELAEATARRSEDPKEMDRITRERQRARAKLGMATARR